MSLITDQDGLKALTERLSKAPYITVDTEFMRDNSYYSKLCLIQVADQDGAFAIDPLSLILIWSLFTICCSILW